MLMRIPLAVATGGHPKAGLVITIFVTLWMLLVSPCLRLISGSASDPDHFAPVAGMSRAVYALAVFRDLRAKLGRGASSCLGNCGLSAHDWYVIAKSVSFKERAA